MSQGVADQTLDVLLSLSPGGAIEAAAEARKEGLIRWIGVTGHGAQIAATHRRSLDRFDFDSVFLDSVGDVNLLPKVLDAASRFAGRPDNAAMAELVSRSAAEPLFV